jgi:hypothetical protein
VSRVRRFSPLVLWMLAAVPLAPASGQNLDAGKPASQIFEEACSNCHRSPRGLRTNSGAGFLREHYTTGSDMASTMAAYLSSAGGGPRTGGPQPKRQPNPAAPAGPAATEREAPAADASRDPRRAQQTGDPKAAPPGSTRSRPVSTRAENTAEIKPPAPPLPSTAETKPPAPPLPAPLLEEFEE